MFTAQLTPRYINPPREAHYRNGSVKDTDGRLWQVPRESLNLFQANVPVNVSYEQYQGNDGKLRMKVVAVNGQAVGQSPTPVGAALPPLPPQPQPAGPVSVGGGLPPAPSQVPPAPQLEQSRSVVSERDKARNMFITGIVGRCLQGLGPEAIPQGPGLTELIRALGEAWEYANPPGGPVVMGQRQTAEAAAHPAFDDSIPF